MFKKITLGMSNVLIFKQILQLFEKSNVWYMEISLENL